MVQVPGIASSRVANVQVVDMAAAISTADLGDYLHPSDEGYVKMGDSWADSLLSSLAGQVVTC
jgi:lysophospholipase L1-like esterase